MNDPTAPPTYRSTKGRRAGAMAFALRFAPPAMALLRMVRPVLKLGNLWVITRYDDVLEVFATDRVYAAPYRANLDVITGGQPFFLGMDDTTLYRAQVAVMRAVVLAGDLPRLAEEAERLATARLAVAEGRVELVSFVRGIAFELMAGYFGIDDPSPGTLALWGSRLFEFQFTGSPDDAEWRGEAEEYASQFRSHIDRAMIGRKAAVEAGATVPDDVLTRCLTRQAAGEPGYDDLAIRTAILCMIVGGPPQPPMVLPQAIDQLLRRPKWLDAACQAARARPDDRGDDRLRSIVMEAMRFDPLAPGFKRVAREGYRLAAGSRRARHIPAGATVFAATASAMMDGRRLAQPAHFDPDRPAKDYVHFGRGLHTCFGHAINRATLHRMVRPVLAQPGLRRAPGRSGRLEKRGPFAHRLDLVFDTPVDERAG
jgi:cytochrome P450